MEKLRRLVSRGQDVCTDINNAKWQTCASGAQQGPWGLQEGKELSWGGVVVILEDFSK